jgi:hypothetical protein
VTLKGLNAKKMQTYCVMLARENRFKWSEAAPTTTTSKPLTIHRFKNAFVTNCGVVYDYKNVYLGPVETSNEFIQKVGRDLGISFVVPAERAPTLLAIPCTTASRFTNVDLYCLYYLSYALQIYSQLSLQTAGSGADGRAVSNNSNNNPGLYIHPASISTLQTFVIPNAKDGKVNAISWTPTSTVYAEEIYGFIPELAEVTSNEIDALRSAFPQWRNQSTNRCVVLVDELFTPEFVQESIAPLLPGWSVEQVLRTSTGSAAYSQLIGAGLCLLYNLPKQEEHWAKLWTLPKGCKVLEFQNELKVEGGFQHLAAAASLDAYCIPLHKGSPLEMRQQALVQFQAWVLANGLPEIRPPAVPDVSSPTGMFLSL